jgi:hypothetical protein
VYRVKNLQCDNFIIPGEMGKKRNNDFHVGLSCAVENSSIKPTQHPQPMSTQNQLYKLG